MAWWLMQNIDKSSFFLAVQHKIVWVVLFSSIVLRKKYNRKQLLGALFVTFGAMISQKNEIEEFNAGYLHYIVLMCVISAFSGVWVELMMKKDRGDLNKSEKLYYYLNDSLHMYVLGLPLYCYSYWNSSGDHQLNIELSVLICMSHALQGLVIGSMFVYYSAVWRSIQSSFTIVVLLILDSRLEINSLAGLLFIMLGSYCWSLKTQQIYTKLEQEDHVKENKEEKV
jgi:drug/metabolite transporter (DMT)-like permease